MYLCLKERESRERSMEEYERNSEWRVRREGGEEWREKGQEEGVSLHLNIR